MKTQFPLSALLPMLPGEVASEIKEHVTDPGEAVVRRKASDVRTQIADGERAAIQVISSRAIDRDGEILDPKGGVFTDYLLNPVVLWAHDYSRPPIGSAEWVKSSADTVTAKTVYANTPFADEVYTLKKEGHLRAASVGFIALDTVWNGERGWNETVQKYSEKWEMKPKEFDNVSALITKWLLLEYSDVPVPANPQALQAAVGKGFAVSAEMMKALGVEPAEQPEVVEEKAPTFNPTPVRIQKIDVSCIRVSPPVQHVSVADLVDIEIRRSQGRL